MSLIRLMYRDSAEWPSEPVGAVEPDSPND